MNNKRNKPHFIRQIWHKHIKLGSTVKKKRKWRKAKGIHSKVRLGVAGKPKRPKIGWGASKEEKNKVNGLEVVRVENVKQLENLKKGQGVIVGKVGKRKRMEIIKKANEKKIEILNRYLKSAEGKK